MCLHLSGAKLLLSAFNNSAANGKTKKHRPIERFERPADSETSNSEAAKPRDAGTQQPPPTGFQTAAGAPSPLAAAEPCGELARASQQVSESSSSWIQGKIRKFDLCVKPTVTEESFKI